MFKYNNKTKELNYKNMAQSQKKGRSQSRHLSLHLVKYLNTRVCRFFFIVDFEYIFQDLSPLFHDEGSYHTETSPLKPIHWFLCDRDLKELIHFVLVPPFFQYFQLFCNNCCRILESINGVLVRIRVTLSCIMLKNGHTLKVLRCSLISHLPQATSYKM